MRILATAVGIALLLAVTIALLGRVLGGYVQRSSTPATITPEFVVGNDMDAKWYSDQVEVPKTPEEAMGADWAEPRTAMAVGARD